MKKVFISYRRDDTQAIAGRLYDGLEARLGDGAVFLDIDSIPLGTDFREHVQATLDRCGVLLVLIGSKWLEAMRDGRRRLDDPGDLVRVEIETALERRVAVVPVLIDQTRMPAAGQLPGSISALAYRNAVRLDSGIDFRNHLARLVAGIVPHLESAVRSDSADAAAPVHVTPAAGAASAASPAAPAPVAAQETPHVDMKGALTTGSAVRSAPQEFADSGLAARIALRMRQAIASWNPWATGMLAALILLAAYAALSFRLGAAVDHVETNLQGLALAAPAASSAAAAKVPDLASALAAEVSAGLLTVIDEPGRTTVRIASDALFETGNNTVEERFMPILGRLAQALSALPGAVLVTGHTDSSELSVSSRFRSKFELSDERARAVAEVLLRGGVADDRLRSEGRSDGEPAAPNDTPAGRARNRRVEVTLFQPFTPSRPAAPKGGS